MLLAPHFAGQFFCPSKIDKIPHPQYDETQNQN